MTECTVSHCEWFNNDEDVSLWQNVSHCYIIENYEDVSLWKNVGHCER